MKKLITSKSSEDDEFDTLAAMQHVTTPPKSKKLKTLETAFDKILEEDTPTEEKKQSK